VALKVRSVVVGLFQENSWVLRCERTGEAILADPGDEPDRISALIDEMGAHPVAIYITHAHIDHVGAVAPLQEKYKIPAYMPEGDRDWLDALPMQAQMFRLDDVRVPRIDGPIVDGQTIRFGDIEGRAIATPGHTPGGTCLYFEREKVLVSGDTLFVGSIGRTDLPMGSWEEIERSIRGRLFQLPDDVTFYPGHGAPGPLGQERLHNPFVGDAAIGRPARAPRMP
jgi:glyoxylase-like metal-dependent hydrolase (beta-lactamase superfamily II)